MSTGKDLSQGNIKKHIWNLAWPMMLSMFFYTMYNLVDAYWVSKLSPESIAAVSISQIALFIMIALGFGITVGSGVIMSMHIGAKKMDLAGKILGQSFVLSVIAGVFFTIIAIIFRNPLLIASGATGDIFNPALDYFTITSAGATLFFVLIAVMFSFNAQGDTFTLTKLFALSTAINLVIDPLLIFGGGPIPAMGISGAAIATLISQALFIMIAIRSLSKSERIVPFKFSNLSFDWESVKKVLAIGIPASLTQIIFPLGLALLTFIVGDVFKEAGAVALSLGFRVEFFAYLPASGFGFAAMSMIGQNIGAQKEKRVKKSFNTALMFAAGGAAGIGLLVAIFSGSVISIFTQDQIVFGYTQSYMWIVAISYGFLAALMVESTSFQALGKSWNGFWIFILRSLVITAPLAYLFSHVLNYPITAIWAAVAVGNTIPAIIGFFWIRKKIEETLKTAPAQ